MAITAWFILFLPCESPWGQLTNFSQIWRIMDLKRTSKGECRLAKNCMTFSDILLEKNGISLKMNARNDSAKSIIIICYSKTSLWKEVLLDEFFFKLFIFTFDADLEPGNDCFMRWSQSFFDPRVTEAGDRRASTCSSGGVVRLCIKDPITPGWRLRFIESSFLSRKAICR